MSSGDLYASSMLDLFRVEAENQAAILNNGLLKLEHRPADQGLIEPLMRAAHSLKGAARIVGLPDIVRLAHVMEDCLVAAQSGSLTLTAGHMDLLLQGADIIAQLGQLAEPEIPAWIARQQACLHALTAALESATGNSPVMTAFPAALPAPPAEPPAAGPGAAEPAAGADRVLRLSAERLDQLTGLAGEVLITTKQIKSFINAVLDIKRDQSKLARHLDLLQDVIGAAAPGSTGRYLSEAQQQLAHERNLLSRHLARLEQYDRSVGSLARRLYESVTSSRMRPFADAAQGLQRTVRDLARTLGKVVRLDLTGADTQVDRDILERLGAPLNHLLRNAVDHGIEAPERRRALDKPQEGRVRLEARHHGGLLQIRVEDDGRGIDTAALRERIVSRGLASADMAASLSEAELFDFLFLPNFSLAAKVTEISGRGVGLDAVLTAVQELHGTIKIHSTPGRGTRFQLSLPLTLAVLKGLLVEIGAEPYVFPLSRIDRVLEIRAQEVLSVEGRNCLCLDGHYIGLVAAHQVLEVQAGEAGSVLRVVLLSDRQNRFGIVVDRCLEEGRFVVHHLDPRLGKVRDIAAATVLENGAPALIIDVDDLVRSIDKLAGGGRLHRVEAGSGAGPGGKAQRILVVEDSFTVREVERKLLESHGYQVDVTVDGMDGWNAVRLGHYDLVITDVDMPRMNGIELVGLLKSTPATRALPVVIVSYKDREEDRMRGLEAGADYYLTKSSFHDETLLEAVKELIGEP